MNDHDYLWDRSGSPDPEIERLENLLRPLGDPGTPPRASRTNTKRRWWPLALAAAAALVIGLYLVRPERQSWATQNGPLYLGQWLNASQATRIQVADIGHLDVAPGSRLRIVASGAGNHRVELEHGELDALILAPPRAFSVATPSAVAVDLGCAYSLKVARDGETLVRVRSGWVAFEQRGEEVFIPAGAHCRTSPQFGLGVPVYHDASPALQAAVARFENSRELVLPADLRSQDGLTLWHLLRRVPTQQREQILNRFVALVPLPAGVDRARILAGDRGALDSLWSALHLGDATLWRQWQRKL